MGLFTALLTLPLAPVRGTVWIAEQLQEQAEAELQDDAGIQAALLELEGLRETGALSEEELAEAEDALIEQLMAIRSRGGA